jgi:predicted ABC-type ATPase
MATKPTIYILAGANGVGKTTVNPFFIPKGVPYINADDIARQFRDRLGKDIGVSEVSICIDRVRNRVLQGGHDVRPDIVKGRYEVGLLLLRQYRAIPDQLILTDNTTTGINCLTMEFGEVVFQDISLPPWVQFVLTEPTKANTSFSSIDEVREKYRQMRKND